MTMLKILMTTTENKDFKRLLNRYYKKHDVSILVESNLFYDVHKDPSVMINITRLLHNHDKSKSIYQFIVKTGYSLFFTIMETEVWKKVKQRNFTQDGPFLSLTPNVNVTEVIYDVKEVDGEIVTNPTSKDLNPKFKVKTSSLVSVHKREDDVDGNPQLSIAEVFAAQDDDDIFTTPVIDIDDNVLGPMFRESTLAVFDMILNKSEENQIETIPDFNLDF